MKLNVVNGTPACYGHLCNWIHVLINGTYDISLCNWCCTRYIAGLVVYSDADKSVSLSHMYIVSVYVRSACNNHPLQ